ncbi:hypothetical protein H6P81_003808 [Aristolochia fimbriata]|uniref:Uncharacterized protein n=1 Tax=Aristolochia fimbriata TaxID=158543 RepID=A0AAV7FDN0_ARIFI|nr:hypothetical protein H6P81_003808 [Aristolochia fimbriata]
MEPSDSLVTVSSPPEAALLSEAESLFAPLLCDITQQVHVGMENMLKMINEIDQCSNEIVEDLDKCKKSTIERKKMLEDDKECFQKAALSVLDMLNNEEINKSFNSS